MLLLQLKAQVLAHAEATLAAERVAVAARRRAIMEKDLATEIAELNAAKTEMVQVQPSSLNFSLNLHRFVVSIMPKHMYGGWSSTSKMSRGGRNMICGQILCWSHLSLSQCFSLLPPGTLHIGRGRRRRC